MSQDSPLVGRLEIEPIRKAFPNEARHFTTWMEEHIDALGERLGLRLTVVQREKGAGAFAADLECEGPDGQRVIVENQLEPTDHDHPGKLLTYLVNLDGAAAIWVTSDPRPEHQKVIDWLNEATPANIAFYLVRAEAVRIGGSAAAPLFTVVAGPSSAGKVAGHERREWAERPSKHVDFWKSLLERSKERTKLFAGKTPGRDYWIAISAGRAGVIFSYTIRQADAGVELFIDHDKTTGEKNKAIFDALFAQKETIERDFGGPLEWQRLDHRRASRILARVTGGGFADPSTWPHIQDRMIDSMVRFYEAVKPRLDKVKV
jgi:aromatic ring-cleaving dioxygenase